MTLISKMPRLAASVLASVAVTLSVTAASAWEPRKPVELLVPAGAGGSSDQFARVIQSIVAKYELMEQPFVVTIKSGANGAEGYMAGRAAARDPYTLVVATSQIFSFKTNAGLPLDYTNFTPIALLAQDQFGLWVAADSPYDTAEAFMAALKEAPPNTMKMGGTGTKTDDNLISLKLNELSGGQLAYIPYKGGGEAATQLVGHHIDANVNNPAENIAQWRAGQVRALCLFGKTRLPYDKPVAGELAWSDIPTCTEAGIPFEYSLPRGILAGANIDPEAAAFYEDVFRRVTETPEYIAYLETNAITANFMPGAQFGELLAAGNDAYIAQLVAAGFTAK